MLNISKKVGLPVQNVQRFPRRIHRKRNIFIDSLLALGFSWAIPANLLNSDREALLLIAGLLALLCFLLLVPFALRNLGLHRPLAEGLRFALGLFPLVFFLSQPAYSWVTLTYTPLTLEKAILYRWGINLGINTLILWMGAFFFTSTLKEKPATLAAPATTRPGWNRVLLATSLLVCFFTATYYTGSRFIAGGLW